MTIIDKINGYIKNTYINKYTHWVIIGKHDVGIKKNKEI